jgi:hypothetical protein
MLHDALDPLSIRHRCDFAQPEKPSVGGQQSQVEHLSRCRQKAVRGILMSKRQQSRRESNLMR